MKLVSMMPRSYQIVLMISTLLLSWLLMQAIHELGHVIGAWLTGGHVTKVVLHPLEISRTDVMPNPQPLAVVWAGPVIGVVSPLLIWLAIDLSKCCGQSFARFFAGFCLIANGAYIAFGSFNRVGDCGEMLRHGSPRWLLWLFGAATIPAGLWLWRQFDHNFIGNQKSENSPRITFFILPLLAVVVFYRIAVVSSLTAIDVLQRNFARCFGSTVW